MTYLLRLADDNVILGQRLGEYISRAPDLEEDLAVANIALDHIGVAQHLYTYAGEVEGGGRSEDEFAFLRSERDFTNALLVEQPHRGFGDLIARQFFFDAYQLELWAALSESSDERLAGIAAKAVKEARYHLRHSSSWMIRLGDGTEESHQRIQRSVDDLLERLSDSETRNELRARLLFASGNRDKLRNHLASGNNFKDEVTALLMAISGLPEQALALQNDLQSRGMSDARGAIVRAKVAFDSGDLIAAKSELQRAVAELTVEDHAFFFVGYDLLAAILQAEGQLTDAVRMLERMEPIRIEAAVNNAGLYWLMCQQHLARLYREIDQHSDATLVENELRELLLLADNNFPLRASLQ